MARVMIIGATSAIAKAVARLCAGRGDTLHLLARNSERLATLCEELGESVCGSESGDFNEFAQNEARVARGLKTLGGVDLVLIAHGSLGDQLRSETELTEALEILDTNLRSVVSFLIPLANALEAQGHGHLAVMSSVAAERGRPRNYTYATGKAGLNVYLQGLRSRLYTSGVKLHILKLGPVHTPMTIDHDKNFLFAQPEQVAGSILRAVDRDRSEVYLPGYWRPIMWLVRILPEPIFQRIKSFSGR